MATVPTKEELENALQVVEGFEQGLNVGQAALQEFGKSYQMLQNEDEKVILKHDILE